MRLNLGKNNLDDIPTDAFHPMVNLEVLDLHENRIRHIPDNAFMGEFSSFSVFKFSSFSFFSLPVFQFSSFQVFQFSSFSVFQFSSFSVFFLQFSSFLVFFSVFQFFSFQFSSFQEFLFVIDFCFPSLPVLIFFVIDFFFRDRVFNHFQ